MLLTVLGCSGSTPGPGSAASGYLLEVDGCRLVLDLGNGVLASLHHHVDPLTVDALLISHLHPDHCADFSALTVLRRYHPAPARDPRAHRLPVHAPSEAPTRFAAAYAPDETERENTDLTDVFDFHPLGLEPLRIGPFRVTAERVAHPCEAFGFRIEAGGRSLAYTGDSGPCPALDRLAGGVDLLLAESSWPHGGDYPADLHMSGRDAGELAARASVGKLLVTHVPPWTDRDDMLTEARSAFRGEAALATQGHAYRV